MKDSHGELTTARATTTIWIDAGRSPLDKGQKEEKEEEEGDERKVEEGGKQEGNGAGEDAGEGKGEGCDGSGSLDEYVQEYAEGIRLERGRERRRAAAAAAALRQEI
jgi:hypothetical protein